MARNKSVKCIKFSDSTWDKIQGVLDKDKSLVFENLERFYAEAVSYFVLGKARTADVQYLSPPRNGEYHSLWLDAETVKNVKYLSKKDNAYENRIIYTAIISYLSTI